MIITNPVSGEHCYYAGVVELFDSAARLTFYNKFRAVNPPEATTR
ncbi:hypothetical protein GCM10011410_12820 [Hoyosella rhizosphaerae]|uniref:Uncharacterized protein n=1 Tax=Hoyosella rhizosphaerae TaxID=1755582 RepID=A0A916XBR3_9ACTN|nr:hypothetical protein GCM10011410_12820 [Hoyosella rhizosphaerae]